MSTLPLGELTVSGLLIPWTCLKTEIRGIANRGLWKCKAVGRHVRSVRKAFYLRPMRLKVVKRLEMVGDCRIPKGNALWCHLSVDSVYERLWFPGILVLGGRRFFGFNSRDFGEGPRNVVGLDQGMAPCSLFGTPKISDVPNPWGRVSLVSFCRTSCFDLPVTWYLSGTLYTLTGYGRPSSALSGRLSWS